MDFLNTMEEANNHEFWPWLEDDEEPRLIPETDIGSDDLDIALNAFCLEAYQFFSQICPEYTDRLQIFLKQNQDFYQFLSQRDLLVSGGFRGVVEQIFDAFDFVFYPQILRQSLRGKDISEIADRDMHFLSHSELTDSAYRIEAFRRLTERFRHLAKYSARLSMDDWLDNLP